MIPTPCIESGCPYMALPGPRSYRCRRCQQLHDHERWFSQARAAYRDPAYKAIIIPATCSIPGCTRKATKDHIVELHQGGSNDPSNIAALCLTHNLEKSNRERRKRKNRTEDTE